MRLSPAMIRGLSLFPSDRTPLIQTDFYEGVNHPAWHARQTLAALSRRGLVTRNEEQPHEWRLTAAGATILHSLKESST